MLQQMAGYPGMMMGPQYPQVDANAMQMMQNLSLVQPGEQRGYMQPGIPGSMGVPGFQGVPYGYMPGAPSMPQAVPHSGMQVLTTGVPTSRALKHVLRGIFQPSRSYTALQRS